MAIIIDCDPVPVLHRLTGKIEDDAEGVKVSYSEGNTDSAFTFCLLNNQDKYSLCQYWDLF